MDVTRIIMASLGTLATIVSVGFYIEGKTEHATFWLVLSVWCMYGFYE